MSASKAIEMVYNVYKKSKTAPLETQFILHGNYNTLELAKAAQADLKKAGFRTRRDKNAYKYGFA